MLDYLKITNDENEMIEIAHRLIEDVNKIKKIYTPLMMEKIYEQVDHYTAGGCSPEERDRIVYRSIYDYWVYGSSIDEEFYLHLLYKTDEEKREYMVKNIRRMYVNHLNDAAGPDRVQQLEDKYRLYQRLKPYYLRDVIEVREMSDLGIFEEFVGKHKEFVVKPADYAFGIGVHKVSMEDYNNDCEAALSSILNEGLALKSRHPSRVSKMVLEELITQDESLAVLHRNSVNAVRATAVRGKDGKIHIYHPWIKVGISGSFVASAALDGFDAKIDPVTGIVITDGYQENGNVFEVHPDSGIKIKGFQIPKWQELLNFVDRLMAELPAFGYIGWDLVLTPKGWCVMEGNYSAEFIFQMIDRRGYKREFEDLIGWKFEKEFWWLEDPTFKRLGETT